jgi:hypothetical protein
LAQVAAVGSELAVSPQACTQAVKRLLSQGRLLAAAFPLPGGTSQHFEPVSHDGPSAASSRANPNKLRVVERSIGHLLES